MQPPLFPSMAAGQGLVDDLLSGLASNADTVGIVLIIFGIVLVLIGSRFMKPLVAVGLFVPVAWTTYAILFDVTNQSADVSIGIALLLAFLISTLGALMVEKMHLILGGMIAMAAYILLYTLVEPMLPFQTQNGWPLLIVTLIADLCFLIGAHQSQGHEQVISNLAPAVAGGLALALGIAMVRAGLSGWQAFDPLGRESSLVLFLSILLGVAIQTYLFDPDTGPLRDR